MINLNETKVVYINEEGIINFIVEGEIAPIEELEYQAMEGKTIKGDFLCAEGFYRNVSDDPLAAEYVLIKPYIDLEYDLKMNLDEDAEILSIRKAGDMLISAVKLWREDIIYFHMLSRKEDGTVQWNSNFIYKDMLKEVC